MFSITICWPSDCDMLSWMVRAIASVAPPGGYGTTSVIGRLGYVCADAEPAAKILAARNGAASGHAAAAPPSSVMNARRFNGSNGIGRPGARTRATAGYRISQGQSAGRPAILQPA